MAIEADLMPQVRAARAGDRDAMERLFERLLPEVHAYVRLHTSKKIRSREATVDVVQTVCREVFVDLAQFRGHAEKQFKKWVFRVALAKIHSRHRYHAAQKRDFRKEVQPAQSSTTDEPADRLLDCYKSFCTPSRHLSAREDVARIEHAFEQLREDHQRVITLACFVGMSHAEIAADMHKSEVAVRKLLSRARAHLAVILARHESEDRAER